MYYICATFYISLIDDVYSVDLQKDFLVYTTGHIVTD